MDASDLVVLLKHRQNGRSLRAFGHEVGVSPSLLSQLLRGHYRLGPSAARRIASAYPDLGRVLADTVAESVLEEVS